MAPPDASQNAPQQRHDLFYGVIGLRMGKNADAGVGL